MVFVSEEELLLLFLLKDNDGDDELCVEDVFEFNVELLLLLLQQKFKESFLESLDRQKK